MNDSTGPDERLAARLRDAYRATPVDPLRRERQLESLERSLRRAPRQAWGLPGGWAPAWGVAAVAAVLLAFFSGVQVGRRVPVPRGPLAADAGVNAAAEAPAGEVEFVCAAPRARRVSLVGDFDGWDASALPMRRAGDGLWTASVRLPVGWHRYAFVVDGSRRVADPSAPMAAASTLGSPSSMGRVGGEPL